MKAEFFWSTNGLNFAAVQPSSNISLGLLLFKAAITEVFVVANKPPGGVSDSDSSFEEVTSE